MKDGLICQCRFSRTSLLTGETEHTIGYIPAWAASVGNKVQLLDLNNIELLWTIDEVGGAVDKKLIFRGWNNNI